VRRLAAAVLCLTLTGCAPAVEAAPDVPTPSPSAPQAGGTAELIDTIGYGTTPTQVLVRNTGQVTATFEVTVAATNSAVRVATTTVTVPHLGPGQFSVEPVQFDRFLQAGFVGGGVEQLPPRVVGQRGDVRLGEGSSAAGDLDDDRLGVAGSDGDGHGAGGGAGGHDEPPDGGRVRRPPVPGCSAVAGGPVGGVGDQVDGSHLGPCRVVAAMPPTAMSR
jgi:hypothetical protein